MNTEQIHELSELLADAAYQAHKFSPLWKSLPSNDAIDKSSERLAKALLDFSTRWIDYEVDKAEAAQEKSAA